MLLSKRRRSATLLVLWTMLATPALAVAQDAALAEEPAEAPPPPPPPTAAPQNTDRAADTTPSDDMENWTAAAGGVFNTGNTESWTLTLGTNFQIIRGHHGFAFESSFNYGRANPTPNDPAGDYQTNARNLLSRARYDLFVTRLDAVFGSVVHRWDPFAGLDSRIQLQTGYQRNFVRESDHRLWAEAGYDLTWDNEHGALDRRIAYHSARLFLGYDNRLNEHVGILTGVEGLLNLERPETGENRDVRLNWESTLRAQASTRLQIEVKFKLLYDTVPVVGARELDTRTTVTLVFDLW